MLRRLFDRESRHQKRVIHTFFPLCRYRALILRLPILGFEVVKQPGNSHFKSVVVLPGSEVGNVVFSDLGFPK